MLPTYHFNRLPLIADSNTHKPIAAVIRKMITTKKTTVCNYPAHSISTLEDVIFALKGTVKSLPALTNTSHEILKSLCQWFRILSYQISASSNCNAPFVSFVVVTVNPTVFCELTVIATFSRLTELQY